MTKVCTKCGLEKDTAKFYAKRRVCKTCINRLAQEKHNQRLKVDADYRRRYNDKINNRRKTRRKVDPIFNLLNRLRVRNYRVLAKANIRKLQKTDKILGCTPLEYKQYLESKFLPGMTWENTNEWDIDHVVPLAWFDLSNEQELKEASHYTNVQPLWHKDNIEKGDRYAGTPDNRITKEEWQAKR